MIYVFVINQISRIPIFIVKNNENNTMYNMPELLLHFAELMLIKLVSSIFLLHSSINLSTYLLLHLQFSQSKYSPKSHDLSHSHLLLGLLGFQICPLSHIPLSINSLHSHRHLFLLQCYLLLQTLASNIHFSCHFICFVSLVLDITININNFWSYFTFLIFGLNTI